MNKTILKLAEQAQQYAEYTTPQGLEWLPVFKENFAELIVQECIDKLEAYRIPVGNSSAGELACEWTYDALMSIRDDIRETFGLPDA